MHLWSLLFGRLSSVDRRILLETSPATEYIVSTRTVKGHTITHTATTTATTTNANAGPTATSHAVLPYGPLPTTEVLAHAPGWTLFRNLYMSNGTLFIVTDENGRKQLPETRMMVSVSMEALATAENIAAREPNRFVMTTLSPDEAKARWTTMTAEGKGLNRVWTVEGNTVSKISLTPCFHSVAGPLSPLFVLLISHYFWQLLSWDPKQFLRHYYHFVAEFIFGVQAFWHGAFSKPVPSSDSPNSPHFSSSHTAVPPIHRVIFAYSDADGWRDDPGFNRYFLRAVAPSLTVEHEEDWADRVAATRLMPGETQERAFHFPIVLLTDRSASFRGRMCGMFTQRTAAEAWDYMRVRGKLMGIHIGGWWAPIREAMWRFSGSEAGLKKLDDPSEHELPYLASVIPDVIDAPVPADESKIVDVDKKYQKMLPQPEKVVISYISRQGGRRRKLIKEDHDSLVQALEDLVERKNKERRAIMDAMDGAVGPFNRRTDDGRVPLEWEFNELYAEKMSKDDQINATARTTVRRDDRKICIQNAHF